MGAFFSLWASKNRSSWFSSPSVEPILSPVPDEPGLWVYFPSESDAAVTLPLGSVTAKVQIRDVAARVELIQTFINNYQSPCEEAVFNFKLEEGVVVCAFEARIGSSCVQGIVKESVVARAEYSEAKAAGYSAYLMEQTLSKNMFSLRLGNIPPSVHVSIVITFACTLVGADSKLSTPASPLDMLKLRLSADCLVPSKVVVRHSPCSSDSMDLRGMDAGEFCRLSAKFKIKSLADFTPPSALPVSSIVSSETKSCPSSSDSTSSSASSPSSSSFASSSTSTPAVIHTSPVIAPSRVQVRIDVSIEACGEISKLDCPGISDGDSNEDEPTATHKHEGKQGEVHWRWTPLLLRRTSASTGFELHIHFARVTEPVVMIERLCVNSNRDSAVTVNEEHARQDYALLLSFNPDLSKYEHNATPRLNCELIFVVDCSGSMGGRRMERTKETLLQALGVLSSDIYVNFVRFGSSHTLLWPKSNQANSEYLSLARDHVKSFEANMGGTNIHGPLSQVLNSPPKEGYARQVFLLTDGEIDKQEQTLVLSLLRSHSDSTRVFAFGLGNAIGREQIKLMAEASRGKPFYIADDDGIAKGKNSAQTSDNLMCEVITTQLSSVLAPSMTYMSFFWDGLQATEAPFRLCPAYHHEPYRVFVLLSVTPEQITLTHRVKLSGRLPNGSKMSFPLELQLSSLLANSSSGSGISQLAARQMARDIEENGSVLQVPYPECYRPVLQYFLMDDLANIVAEYCTADGLKPDPALARQELLRLGLTFQIITSLTSFVCVDRSVLVAKNPNKPKAPPSSVYKPTGGPSSRSSGFGWPSPKMFSQLYGRRESRSLMLGLDSAGKTTILYHLKLGEVVTTVPTIGFNVETVEFHGICLTMWDVGGQDKIRPLWRHYYQNTQCVVFVVDSTDFTRFPNVKEALSSLRDEPELLQCHFLVLANKQDCLGACSVLQLAWEIGLSEWRDNWFIQGCSGLTGAGLSDGLAWLAKKMMGR